MPNENSTNPSNRSHVPLVSTDAAQDMHSPGATAATELPAVATSRGDTGANAFRNRGGHGVRRRLSRMLGNNSAAAAATSTPSSEIPASADNTHAPAGANGAAETGAGAGAFSTLAAQTPSDPQASPNGNASTAVDPAKVAADEQHLRERIAQAKNNNQPSLDGLSDSTKKELMTQLGGHKNMDYEGTHQADEASKDMAKQSDRWGKEV